MDVSYRSILFLMLCCISNLVSAQDYEDPEELDPRISVFHKNARMARSIKKPDPVKGKSYPGCGFRSPKIKGTSRQISNTSSYGRGLISHNGKRSTSGGFPMIVGGNFAQGNSWPWMVALHTVMNGQISKSSFCGASLISQNYVLTAAHCFHGEGWKMDTDPSKLSVVVGAHSGNDGTAYPVRQILIHQGYKRPFYYHDIAIIAVGKPVKLSKKVYPVCLPSHELTDKIETDNSNVTVIGWGRTSFGGRSSEELRELTIPIVPLKECNTSYSRLSLPGIPLGVTEQEICAGGQKEGTCHGDSGGPLLSKLKDNSYVQIGIVAFGYKCAQPGYPTVYTRVSQYTKWIYVYTDLGK